MTRPNTVRARAGLWLAAAAVAASALVTRCPSRRPAPAPDLLESWGVADMRARLGERLPHLVQTADAADGSFEAGFYLTAAPASWEALNHLPRTPERAGRWRGVAHCRRYGVERPVADGWGEHGLAAGPFLFFGDPELLAQIRVALQEREENRQ
jgi:hypothetical protein